jgi:hypothetical protein
MKDNFLESVTGAEFHQVILCLVIANYFRDLDSRVRDANIGNGEKDESFEKNGNGVHGVFFEERLQGRGIDKIHKFGFMECIDFQKENGKKPCELNQGCYEK